MYPLVRDGTVYWVAYAPDGDGTSDRTLFAHDIADEASKALATGTFNRPHLLGDSIVTISLSDDGRESAVVQVPLDDDPTLLLDEITDAAGITDLAASGDSVAWITGEEVFLLESGEADRSLSSVLTACSAQRRFISRARST